MSVNYSFVIHRQNIIVLCICRHDMVAIMMSNPGVSNKFDIEGPIFSFVLEADHSPPYLRGECF